MLAPDQRGGVQPWSRRRLLATATAVVLVASLLAGGATYFVVTAVAAHSTAASTAKVADLAAQYPVGAEDVRGQAYRDALAAVPMMETLESDMQPNEPTLQTVDPIEIPPSTTAGAVGVPTGFPETPEGAVGQLAAVEIAALRPLSLASARAVYAHWSNPGADFATWEIAGAIRDFHASAGTLDGDPTLSLTATPVAAQIKGTDGDRWVLACVELDIQITVTTTTRFGYGHCDRMEWTNSHWQIAEGAPPAPAPSTWPGSERSRQAGWKTWSQEISE